MLENNILTKKNEIRNQIINYKNDIDVQKLQSLYFSKSYLEILSVSRREMSHSSFLTWVIDNNENHQLSFFGIKKLLEIISLRCPIELENQNQNFFNSILTDNYIIESLTVEKEKGLPKGRLDIYVEVVIIIENKEQIIKLIIENKVESKENNDQTNIYFNHFENCKKVNELNLYVYLTANSNLDLAEKFEPNCNCKNFIEINYQSLVDYLLEPALNQNISDKTKFIIKEYLQSLSQPAINNNDIKHKQKLIMALGNEERELLTKFWEKNQKLILSAMYANSINENLDPEERAKNIVAYESFSKGSGIGIKVQDYFARLCKNEYLNNHVENLIDLTYSKNNFNIGQSLLIKKTNDVNCGLDEKGYPRYYKKNLFSINGTDYMLSSQWTSKNIENFLKWCNQFELETNVNE